MEKKCIGEKLYMASNYFIIAYNELDEYIKVSSFPVFICGGTFYYNDNTAKTKYYTDELKKLLDRETAKTFIYNLAPNDKITIHAASCHAACPAYISEEQEEKQNARLYAKLKKLTWREYLNGKI